MLGGLQTLTTAEWLILLQGEPLPLGVRDGRQGNVSSDEGVDDLEVVLVLGVWRVECVVTRDDAGGLEHGGCALGSGGSGGLHQRGLESEEAQHAGVVVSNRQNINECIEYKLNIQQNKERKKRQKMQIPTG